MEDVNALAVEPRRFRWLGRLRRASAWALPGLAVLAALLLAPTLATGYLSDDTVTSLTPGILRFHAWSLMTRVLSTIQYSMRGGRFFPLIWLPFSGVFYVFRDVISYKIYIYILVISNIGIFYALVRRLFGDARLACLATCLTLMLFQLRAYHDPILSFFGQIQLVAAATFLSLLALERYLEGRGRRWLAASVGLYLACLLVYEASYPFFLLHAVLIGRRRPWRGADVWAIWPFVRVTAFCIAMSLLLRWLHAEGQTQEPPTTYHYRMNLAPRAVLATLARQTSGALPLSYFLADPAGLFGAVKGPRALARWIGQGDTLAIAALALVVSLIGLGREREQEPAPGVWVAPALLGGLLALLPAMMISFTARYQAEITLGKAYVPVYLQYFGVGLILATAIRGGLRWWPANLAAGGFKLALAAVVGTTMAVTYRANCVTAASLNAAPGTPDYNEAAFGMGGGWHYHRLNLEAALRAGLLQPVPEHARLVLERAYPVFHEPPFSGYFYAMHARKVLETIAPFTLNAAPATTGPTFTVRDVCLGQRSGYVLLSRLDGGRELRLFVRHPRLFRSGSSPAFLVVGQSPGSAEAGSYLMPSPALTRLRSGRDWGLFSLDSEAGRVEPRSLKLLFDPARKASLIAAGGPGSSRDTLRGDLPLGSVDRASFPQDPEPARR